MEGTKFLVCYDESLVAMMGQILSGDCVGVSCVPFAALVPHICCSQNKTLGIGVFVILFS